MLFFAVAEDDTGALAVSQCIELRMRYRWGDRIVILDLDAETAEAARKKIKMRADMLAKVLIFLPAEVSGLVSVETKAFLEAHAPKGRSKKRAASAS